MWASMTQILRFEIGLASTEQRGTDVHDVKVEVRGTFGNPGEAAREISYRVQVRADAPQAELTI